MEENLTLKDLVGSLKAPHMPSILPGSDAWELREPWWKWERPCLPPVAAAVVLLDEKPVAVARMFLPVDLSLRGVHVKAIGIGGVYTLSEHRGRGYAAMAIRSCFCHGFGLGCGAAVLYSKLEAKLYRKLGFVELKAHKSENNDTWIFARSFHEEIKLAAGDWRIAPTEKF